MCCSCCWRTSGPLTALHNHHYTDELQYLRDRKCGHHFTVCSVRDAVTSAVTHTPHPQSAHSLHPVCLEAWQIQNTVTSGCVGVQWTDRLGQTFPLHSCLLNDVYFGLWWSTSECPPPKVCKPITNYSAGFCSLICLIISLVYTKFDSREGLFSTNTLPSLSWGGGVEHHISQNCVFIIKTHYGQGLNDTQKFLWTNWMTKEDSCYPVRLTPTVTGKQITATLSALCHTEWCYCHQILIRSNQLTLPTSTALMKLG